MGSSPTARTINIMTTGCKLGTWGPRPGSDGVKGKVGKASLVCSAASLPVYNSDAPVAQWIRASRFERDGRGFESLRVLQL